MDRTDKENRVQLAMIGESKVREDHRRGAYEVLNDKVSHIDRHGAGTAEIEDLRSAFDAFLKAKILHAYEAQVWLLLIQSMEMNISAVQDEEEAEEEAEAPKARRVSSNSRSAKRVS